MSAIQKPPSAMVMGRTKSTLNGEVVTQSGAHHLAGLSTELEDITEVEYRQLRLDSGVVLVWVLAKGSACTGDGVEAALKVVEEELPRPGVDWRRLWPTPVAT